MKNEELIRKWLTDQLSQEEKKLLQESDEFTEMQKIWNGLSVATPPDYPLKQELERFHSTHQKQGKVVKMSKRQTWVGIAASIILISVIGFLLLRPSKADETIMLAEGLKTYYLPDSSIVTLNKGSNLTYETDDWFSLRKVRLQGEGFFQVKSGSTFEVITTDGTVSVLGTSFNVKQRDGHYEVICYEGKVSVQTTSLNLELEAGNGYTNAANGKGSFQATLNGFPEWINGKSSFYRTPYFVVLKELENQFDISVETSNIDLNSTFTGSFPNNNLIVALDAVTIPSGYHYTKKNDKVLIKSEKE